MAIKHWIISALVLAVLLGLNGYMQSQQDKADAGNKAAIEHKRAKQAERKPLDSLQKDAQKMLSLDKITR